jgi:phospholipase/lecithinase/hemolysin
MMSVTQSDRCRNISGLGILFPAVLEYEVPAFLADRSTDRNGTDQPYFSTALAASNAVYSLWIGTNDLGTGLFLTDAQIHGLTLPDYTECIYRVFDQLYASGARMFVLFNNAPLHLTPLYANDTLMGVGDNQYWNPKPDNHTAIAEKMHEYVASTNTIFKYQTPYEALIAHRYPGANLAVFNVWQLLSDVYDNPTAYFNGTEPANVTGYEHHCTVNQSSCTLMYNGTSSDSFMWYDELHPRYGRVV